MGSGPNLLGANQKLQMLSKYFGGKMSQHPKNKQKPGLEDLSSSGGLVEVSTVAASLEVMGSTTATLLHFKNLLFQFVSYQYEQINKNKEKH